MCWPRRSESLQRRQTHRPREPRRRQGRLRLSPPSRQPGLAAPASPVRPERLADLSRRLRPAARLRRWNPPHPEVPVRPEAPEALAGRSAPERLAVPSGRWNPEVLSGRSDSSAERAGTAAGTAAGKAAGKAAGTADAGRNCRNGRPEHSACSGCVGRSAENMNRQHNTARRVTCFHENEGACFFVSRHTL